MTKSWETMVTEQIRENTEQFARDIYEGTVKREEEVIYVNPCPFCHHNDCYTLLVGSAIGRCYACKVKGTQIELVMKLKGEKAGSELLKQWLKIPHLQKETPLVSNRIKNGTKLRHYKGGQYVALGHGHHTETREPLIGYYNPENPDDLHFRPPYMFDEIVMVKGKFVNRFNIVEDEENEIG